MTIQDVATAPYVNGRTRISGAVTALSGIITADTAISRSHRFPREARVPWYMHSTSQPWSGIWLTTADPTAQKLMSGSPEW